MGKTADVHQSIWTDPWFLALSPDAKFLYLWSITTDHGNLAGLFTVAEPMIRFETGLTAPRLQKALDALTGKLIYRPESGALWVVGRAKWVRSKTRQIAKSIARAVAECPEPELQSAFVEKYGSSAWLGDFLSDLALQAGFPEPHLNLDEVPSTSTGQSQGSTSEKDNGKSPSASVACEEFEDWLAHFHEVTGRTSMQGSAESRRFFNARRRDGRSLEELKFATVGCHSQPDLVRKAYDRPETILRACNVERYIELGRPKLAAVPDRTDPYDSRMTTSGVLP